MKLLLGLFFATLSLASHAATVKDVKINYVGIYGNGKIFASLDTTIPIPECSTASWVMISDTHNDKDRIYSMLLAAHAAGNKIDINSNSCLSGQATITEGTSDYILVK
ncbi:MAG: hypothetical protein COA42_05075 [Alteromonadaceae bacterium]|nr:MAG: hypothetical protein COA42_05075 [Alteromonadaceae bacterium]